MCDADDRLGAKGVQEIKDHPFFRGMDWEALRDKESKYRPKVGDNVDCSRFDKFEEEESFYPSDDRRNRKLRKDINFVGYTYKADVEEQKSKLVQAL